MLDELVLWFFSANQEEFGVLAAARDDLVWVEREVLLWFMLMAFTNPRW